MVQKSPVLAPRRPGSGRPGLEPDALLISEGAGVPQRLLDLDMQLIRAEWADFRMERAYWTALQDMAEARHVAPARLVSIAKMRFPNVATEDAVRLSIVDYFRMQSGQTSSTNIHNAGYENNRGRDHVAVPRAMENSEGSR